MRQRIPRGETKKKILDLLEESGGMTRFEIERAAGLSRSHAAAMVSRLSKAWPNEPKKIYVSHYVHDQEGSTKYPRAVYCLGDNADALRPKANPKKTSREWAKLRLRRLKNSFVFNLGVPRDILFKRGKIEGAV